MIALDDIREGSSVIPTSEATRNSRMQNNIRLYNRGPAYVPKERGFSEAGDNASTAPGDTIPVNWYRRIALNFSEFVYGEQMEITIRGEEQLTEAVRTLLQPSLYRSLFLANVDTIRCGTGVNVSPWNHPGSVFQSYLPTTWYPLYDSLGEDQIADILIRRHEPKKVGEGRVIVDIFYFGEDPPPSERRIYKLENISFGPLETTYTQESYLNRRVHVIAGGYPTDGYGESLYEDITQFVDQLGEKLGNLGGNLKRNSEPHLYGPDGAIELAEDQEADGSTEINALLPEGAQYIPVEPGGIPPNYLQWDTNADAFKIFFELCEESVFNFTGLTRSLYDPSSALSGNVTGSALRRLLIPFVSRVNRIKETNRPAVEGAIRLFAETQGFSYTFPSDDVDILWGFDRLLGDDEAEAGANNGNGEEPGAIPEGS